MAFINTSLNNLTAITSWTQVRTDIWTDGATTKTTILGISSNGTLWAWGDNSYGQLGDNSTVSSSVGTEYSPVQIMTTGAVTQVDIRQGSVIAKKNDHTWWGWGRNTFGQLGDGTTIHRSSPVQINAGTSWFVGAYKGANHTLAYGMNGKLYTWGRNDTGQLGDGTTVHRSTPTKIPAQSWIRIAAGTSNFAAIRADGTLWAWGDCSYVDGRTLRNRSYPAQVNGLNTNHWFVGSSLSSWTAVACGNGYSLAITSDNRLFGWGVEQHGSLGRNASTPFIVGYPTPSQFIQIPGSWTSVSARDNTSAGIRTDGTLWMWGYNFYGQVGDGTRVDRSSPVQIPGSWTYVYAGKFSTTGIRTDGTIWAWGLNGSGQLGDLTRIHRSSPVQVSSSGSWSTAMIFSDTTQGRAAAIKTDGTLWMWGFQDPTFASSPVQIGTSSWTMVDGNYTRYAVRSDNTLWQLSYLSTMVQTTVPYNTSWTQINSSISGPFLATDADSHLWVTTWGALPVAHIGNVNATTSSAVTTLIPVSTEDTFGGVTVTSLSGTASPPSLVISAGADCNFALSDAMFEWRGSVPSPTSAHGTLNVWGGGTSTPVQTSNWHGDLDPYLLYLPRRINARNLTSNSGFSNVYYQTVFQEPSGQRNYLNFANSTIATWDFKSAGTGGPYAIGDQFGLSGSPLTSVSAGSDGAFWVDSSGRVTGAAYATPKSPIILTGSNAVAMVANTATALEGNGLAAMANTSGLTLTARWGVSSANAVSVPQVSTGGSVTGTAFFQGTYLEGNFDNLYYKYTDLRDIYTAGSQSLYMSGQGSEGNLGNNTTVSRSSMAQVGSGKWKQVSIGPQSGYTAAIDRQGRLWMWGNNSDGQLGQNDRVHRSSPVQVGTSSWLQVSCSSQHTVALRADGTLWAWGYNSQYELGQGDIVSRSSPVQIGTSSWLMVSAGGSVTHAIRTDGSLWGWGGNVVGMLGNNTAGPSISAVQIGSSSWSSITAGKWAVAAIRSDGALFTWGWNVVTNLGLGDTITRSSPTQVSAGSSWASISVGTSNMAGIRSDGTLWAWGLNQGGQVGDGTIIHRSSPVQIGTSSWIAVAPGESITLAIKYDQTLWKWGFDNSGVAGDGTMPFHIAKSSPVQVTTPHFWRSVVTDGSVAAYIKL
jgi:alpha-tubulin suppressor-like RCC1 family protein